MEEFNNKKRWQKLAGITEELNMAPNPDQEVTKDTPSGELKGAGLGKLKKLLDNIAPNLNVTQANKAINSLFAGRETSPQQNIMLVNILKGILSTQDIEGVKAVLMSTKEK